MNVNTFKQLSAFLGVAALSGVGAWVGTTESQADEMASAAAPAVEDASAFWETFHVSGGVEIESFDSLGAMGGGADLVVRGTIEDVQISRTLANDAEEASVVLAAAMVRVSTVLKGETSESVIPVELLLPMVEDATPAAVSKARSAKPQGEIVVALRDIGEVTGRGKGALYRPVNYSGLFAKTATGVGTPLHPHTGPEVAAAAKELKDGATLDDVAHALASSR